MEFDQSNNVVKLCTQGMDMEGKGKSEEATKLFLKAWNEAASDFEKFTAAHYVARHQKNIPDKLNWHKTAEILTTSRIENKGKAYYKKLATH